MALMIGTVLAGCASQDTVISKERTEKVEETNDSADVVKFLQYYSPSGAEEEYRNWENPKTVESKAQAEEIEKKLEEKNRGPEEIQGPAPLVVPGSPVKVKLGEVKIGKEENENPNKSDKKEMILNLKPKPSNEL